VTQGKFAPAEPGHPLVCAYGAGTPTSDAPAERGRPLVCACGAGTQASDTLWGGDIKGDSLADFGCSEREGDPQRIAPSGV
jgi:hypothetical protein